MANDTSQRILLGVTGGIAAYKSADLVRRLIERGADVQVVMTRSAREFVTPLTFQALSGRPVRSDLWDAEAEAAMGHIELARWADQILVAPATANFIARLAHGMADDLLTTLCLASDAPLNIAPAMNRLMWANAATQENVRVLTERGINWIGPADGDQACGETGPGRMIEPEIIAKAITRSFMSDTSATKNLRGKTVMITAGPTREAIDPVRYISNRSSGKMGYAIARAANAAGANVILVSGPVSLDTPPGIQRIDVETAADMLEAVNLHLADCDIFIGAAAVADYAPVTVAEQKIKKSDDNMRLEMRKAPDILTLVAVSRHRPFTVGFAAETENLEANALAKLEQKNLDMIAANRVGEGLAFDQDTNALAVYWKGGRRLLPPADKLNIAQELIALIIERMTEQPGKTTLRQVTEECKK